MLGAASQRGFCTFNQTIWICDIFYITVYTWQVFEQRRKIHVPVKQYRLK